MPTRVGRNNLTCCLAQEAVEILGNDTSDDGEKLGALQALHILLEPIDNANGKPNSEHILHVILMYFFKVLHYAALFKGAAVT